MRASSGGEAAQPARCVAAYPPATAATPARRRTVPWRSISRTTRYILADGCTAGPALRFPPKPAAGPAGTLHPAGTSLCGDASQPNCGSQYSSSPTSPFHQSRTPRFNEATWNRPRSVQGLQHGVTIRSVGQVVAGLAAVQVLRLGRRPSASWPGLPFRVTPHPLGAEHIAPRPLASLGHRYLTASPHPATRHCAAPWYDDCPSLSLRLDAAGARTPETCGLLVSGRVPRRTPGASDRTCCPECPARSASPWPAQGLPKGLPATCTEGVVSGNPSGLEVAQPQGPLQQFQGQLRLRPVAPPLLGHYLARRTAGPDPRSNSRRQIQALCPSNARSPAG